MSETQSHRSRWLLRIWIVAVLAVFSLSACGESADDASDDSLAPEPETTTSEASDTAPSTQDTSSDDSPSGLQPYDPTQPGGEAPDYEKIAGIVIPSNAEYFLTLVDGAEVAANEEGFEFLQANSNGDPVKGNQQLEQMIATGASAIYIGPDDVPAQREISKRVIEDGVFTIGDGVHSTVLQLAADQYQVGKALADNAAAYIEENLPDGAKVVIINEDTFHEHVKPRWQAMRDVLGAMPNVEIVADQSPNVLDKDSAFQLVSTVLQQHPDIDVILGSDFAALGGLAALEAADAVKDTTYAGGINGSQEAMDAIVAGDSAYKATVAYPIRLFSYATMKYGFRYLEGESVPKVLQVYAVALTDEEAISELERDMANVSETFADAEKVKKYLNPLGNISYETRDSYLADDWRP